MSESAKDADRDLHEWTLERVHERVHDEADGVQDNSLWTGLQHIKAEASKTDFVERDEIQGLLDDLEAEGKLVYWHGLVAPTQPEHIDEILRSESMAETPRPILIGRLNKAKQAQKQKVSA